MTNITTATTAGERTAYLVLGMHRSGTSAAAQLLALAGADLPANLMPGDEYNAKGYFEPWKIAQFNDERLRAGGSAWDDMFAFPYAEMGRREDREWLNRGIDIFRAEFGEAPHPLLKDPRVTVLLPFWRTVLADLEVGARCLIPVRHPLAVAGSLSRRDGFAPQKSLLVWTAYMLAAEAYTRDLPRVFVDYDALLADWRGQIPRIEAAFGAPLPALSDAAGKEIDAFLTPELRHNAGEGDLAGVPRVGEIVAPVYDWFLSAARDTPRDPAILAAAQARIEALREEMGVFIQPLTRDLNAARAELLDVRQHYEFERGRRRALEAEFDRLRRLEPIVDQVLGES